MSRNRGALRLGIDLGVLVDDPALADDPPFMRPMCPGASLRITREDARALQGVGVRFETSGTSIPVHGYGEARVQCDRETEAQRGASGHVVYAGRCRACGELEKDNRALLRSVAGR